MMVKFGLLLCYCAVDYACIGKPMNHGKGLPLAMLLFIWLCMHWWTNDGEVLPLAMLLCIWLCMHWWANDGKVLPLWLCMHWWTSDGKCLPSANIMLLFIWLCMQSRWGKTLQKSISLSKINLCKVLPHLLCQLVAQLPSSSVGTPTVSISYCLTAHVWNCNT